MSHATLLPDAEHLECLGIKWDGSRVTIQVASSHPTAICPQCGESSHRVHSHYQRRLADLPWQGAEVSIGWRNRRFFCYNASCPQRIFTEQLPEVAAPHARKTHRLAIVIRALALACGGEAGSRLARRLEIVTSPDTMLRAIRCGVRDNDRRVRVLGVDDWALRRGQRYGTILVDLEAHRTIDLLSDRTAESFAGWLKKHPEVEIISRDRGECYIHGANIGAPQAKQVADRWHLLHNLYETMSRLLDRFPQELRHAAQQAFQIPVDQPPPAPPLLQPTVPLVEITKHEQCLKPRRARWVEKYQQVLELHGQQCSRREIARQLHLDRGTVDRWLQAGCLPVRAGRTRHSRVETWVNYLTSRWQAGCTNAVVLAEELRQKGFTGSYDSVRRFVASWRIHKEAASTAAARAPPPSAKLAAWWLLKTPADRSAEQQQFVKILCEMCPVVDRAASLATEFATMVRDRKSSELPDWLNRATAPESAVEIRRFAKGLQEDLSAVDAALSLPWSNGQTEGQVNRLKLIKRQMFGRAKFDLLRDRVIAYD